MYFVHCEYDNNYPFFRDKSFTLIVGIDGYRVYRVSCETSYLKVSAYISHIAIVSITTVINIILLEVQVTRSYYTFSFRLFLEICRNLIRIEDISLRHLFNITIFCFLFERWNIEQKQENTRLRRCSYKLRRKLSKYQLWTDLCQKKGSIAPFPF